MSVPSGGFQVFRLEAIRQVGGYNVNIKGAAEDGDISIRIKNAGGCFPEISLRNTTGNIH